MVKKSFYPKSIEQPNKNKKSGLAGICFKEIRRNGKSYNVSCRDQKDPKYHHQWINTTNLKEGKTTQCGKASKYHCSHKTYYGIKGYRNTCPIAGVTGTYTQPAALKMKFDVSSIDSTSKINKVIITLKHRCVGVDVGNSKTTVSWGPNFYGFKHYPNRKVLKLRFYNKNNKLIEEVYKNSQGDDFQNPPLSTNYNEIKAIFKKISYSDLAEGYLELQYGNNLSTNPGNIYVKGLTMTVDYNPQTVYIEGTANKNTLITSTNNDCATEIIYNLNMGYKAGKTKTASKDIQNKLTIINKPNNVSTTIKKNSNKADATITIKDTSGVTGTKKITFGIKGTDKKITFKYEANAQQRPVFNIPSIFEYNVYEKNIPIVAKNGCAENIKIYDNSLDSTPIFELKNDDNQTCIDNKNKDNIITETCMGNLYKTIAQLSCGFHDLYIQVNNEDKKFITKHKIRIDSPPHIFSLLINNQQTKKVDQSETPANIKISYETDRNFIAGKFPKFNITLPLTSEPSVFNIEEGTEYTGTVDISKNGIHSIIITEKENICIPINKILSFDVISDHKQYYDKIFVKTQNTNLNCEYLTVWPGDKNTIPIYISDVKLNNSINNIRFCSKQENQTGIIGTDSFPLIIKNTSNTDITNLLVELNVLMDNNGDINVTTDEWVETDGMFYNFKNNFEQANPKLTNIINILNLTKDNDFIDEENVYLQINEIKAQKSLRLEIPYGSKIEKEVYLQLLMFETPVNIYPENCTGNTFSQIKLTTHDSLLVDLRISGKNNLSQIQCDNTNGSYFETDITYTAENIDTSNLTKKASLLIDNDPRLTPVGIVKNGSLKSMNSDVSKISFSGRSTQTKTTPLANQKITGQFSFLNEVVYNFESMTDDLGRANFYVIIPDWVSQTYSVDDIMSNAVIKYKGIGEYTDAELNNKNNRFAKTTFSYLPDTNGYKKNEMVVITVVLETKLEFIQNKIQFNADVISPGKKDEVTIRYRIYNLKNYSGIIKTILKTNEVDLIPHQIEKEIYCRINTNLFANSHLMKKVVEEREINTLQVSLSNKQRDNKDIIVKIGEIDFPKYNLLNINTDIGRVEVEIDEQNEDIYNIYWKIDYMEKDEIAIGIFDFVAKDLSLIDSTLSTLEITVRDFLSDNIYTAITGDYCCQQEQNQG